MSDEAKIQPACRPFKIDRIPVDWDKYIPASIAGNWPQMRQVLREEYGLALTAAQKRREEELTEITAQFFYSRSQVEEVYDFCAMHVPGNTKEECITMLRLANQHLQSTSRLLHNIKMLMQ